MKFKINLDEFIQILEYISFMNGDKEYENLKKSEIGLKKRHKTFLNFLKKHNLTKEKFTTIEQLQIINKLYERKFNGKIQ